LRTPLNTLKLLIHTVSLMRAQGESAELNLDAIDRQSDRLIGLVDRLLDVSRISSGRLELEREPMELVALAREVANRFRHEVKIDVCSEGPVMGEWDRMRIDQVLTNLLSNAVKYGQGKPIHIRVTKNDGTAEVTVEDQGIGIAELDQKRLFMKFERIVSSRSF